MARPNPIDLRSDTVTLPSPAMRAAIFAADVGDDVYGEDPTVNRLEALTASMLGKEAALLVPTGTMGNLVSLLTHCQRGQRVIVGADSHIYFYEAGGASALGGIAYHPVPNVPDGTLDMASLTQALETYEKDDPHFAPFGLICLENPHNRCGGVVVSIDSMQQVHTLAQHYGIPLHLDGARIFNAAIALGVDVRALTQHVDTIQICLSKSLAAPIGSLIAGSSAFIHHARLARKMLGGGMRQAGIIAAAGIVALDEMVARLADDHANARRLAQVIADIPGIAIDLATVQTNMVMFTLTDPRFTPNQFLAALQAQGILMGSMSGQLIRAVTHYGIETADIDQVSTGIHHVLR